MVGEWKRVRLGDTELVERGRLSYKRRARLELVMQFSVQWSSQLRAFHSILEENFGGGFVRNAIDC